MCVCARERQLCFFHLKPDSRRKPSQQIQSPPPPLPTGAEGPGGKIPSLSLDRNQKTDCQLILFRFFLWLLSLGWRASVFFWMPASRILGCIRWRRGLGFKTIAPHAENLTSKAKCQCQQKIHIFFSGRWHSVHQRAFLRK